MTFQTTIATMALTRKKDYLERKQHYQLIVPAAFGLRPRIDWATRDYDPLWVSIVVAGAGACA